MTDRRLEISGQELGLGEQVERVLGAGAGLARAVQRSAAQSAVYLGHRLQYHQRLLQWGSDSLQSTENWVVRAVQLMLLPVPGLRGSSGRAAGILAPAAQQSPVQGSEVSRLWSVAQYRVDGGEVVRAEGQTPHGPEVRVHRLVEAGQHRLGRLAGVPPVHRRHVEDLRPGPAPGLDLLQEVKLLPERNRYDQWMK